MAFAIAFLVLLLIYVEGDNKKRMTEGIFVFSIYAGAQG